MAGTKLKPRRSGWIRPRRSRVLAIRDRLRELYGIPEQVPHRQPIDEIVRTVLSQHTNDLNRDRAFDALSRRFAERLGRRCATRRSPEVEEAIRPGGLAKQKAPRIQAILGELGDPPNADWLEHAPRSEAMGFLTGLPGVGRKTAACVQIFTWGIPEIPVDVHVHRVGGRLGLFRPGASFEQAHDEMLAIVDPAGRLRAAHEPDPPRPRGLPPKAPLRRVRAAPDVPLVSPA